MIKRKMLSVALVVLIAFIALALDRRVLSVTTIATGTNQVTTTTDTLKGYIEEVTFIVPSGATGNLWLTVSPGYGLDAITIAEATSATESVTIRPRVSGTGSMGTSSNDHAWLLPVVGSTLEFGVNHASATNITFGCMIVFEK